VQPPLVEQGIAPLSRCDLAHWAVHPGAILERSSVFSAVGVWDNVALFDSLDTIDIGAPSPPAAWQMLHGKCIPLRASYHVATAWPWATG